MQAGLLNRNKRHVDILYIFFKPVPKVMVLQLNIKRTPLQMYKHLSKRLLKTKWQMH